MTHSQLTYLLKDLALAAGAASFWYGPQTNTSINYDAPFPQAHLFLMPSRLKAGIITTQVGMCFYGKDEHENAYLETDNAQLASSNAIQDEMDVLTQEFTIRLEDTPGVEIVNDDVKRLPALRKGAQVGTGYWVEFELKHTGVCL